MDIFAPHCVCQHSEHWAQLLCCLSTSPATSVWWCCFCKSQEKLPSAIRCGFLSLQNAEQSSTRLIFAHKHTAPSPPFLSGSAAVKDYSSSPCITGEGFPNLCSGGKDGWCPLPGSKREQGFPEEVGEERLGGSCHPLQGTVTPPPAPWWLLPGVCTVWT